MGKKYNDPSIQNALGIADGTFLVPVAHPTTGKIYKIPVSLLQALFSGYLNKQTGSSYTPSLNDMNGVVQMNNASANAVNIPSSTTVAYQPGAQLCVWNYGAGATTINAASGVVITNNVTNLSQGQSAVLIYNGKNGSSQDEWVLMSSATGTTTGGGGTGATTLNAPVLTAGTPTATTVPLTWTDTNTSPNESSFEYQQSSNGGTTWVAASPGTAAANATGATAGGLTGSTAYQFRVRAVGDGTTTTTSAWSNIVSATTLAGVTYLTWSAINSQLQQYNTNKGIQKLSTSANGWGAVAYSNQTFADGNSMVVKLDASTAVHRILSLNPTAANQGDSAPGWKWGMYLKADGTVDIYENGVAATGGASITTWAASSYFRIRVSGTSVIYEKSTDGATWTTIATSAQAFSGTPIGCVEVYNPSAGFEEVSKS